MAPPDGHRIPQSESHGTRHEVPGPLVDDGDSSDGTHVSFEVTSSSLDEVNRGTAGLFSAFVTHRLQRDGHSVPENLAQRRSMASERAVSRELVYMGDAIYNDVRLNHCISQLHVDSETAYETFECVANQMFQDGVINWGRIVMLFIFGYKLALRVIECQSTLLSLIVKWVSRFVMDKFAHWIVRQGGWGALIHQYGATAKQTYGVVLIAGLIIAYLYWKK